MTKRRGYALGLLFLLALLVPSSVLAQSLRTAAKEGNLSRVKTLIAKNHNINATDANGNTPLILAVRYRKREVAKYLIRAGANVRTRNKAGQTALYWAKRNQDTYLIKLLRQGGATR